MTPLVYVEEIDWGLCVCLWLAACAQLWRYEAYMPSQRKAAMAASDGA